MAPPPLPRLPPRLIFLLFVIGAVMGPVYDGFHTFSATLVYTTPWVLRMAWWVPLLLGLATALIGVSHLDFDRRFPHTPPYPLTGQHVVLGIVLFGAQYFMSGFLKLPTGQQALLQAVVSAQIWYLFDRSRPGACLAVLTGIIGMLSEATLIRWGLFHYSRPDVLGVPFWLPFIYTSASVAVGNVACVMQKNR
jgi:hypothetical protein